MPNLDLVPANRGLILVEKLLHNIKEYEKRLQTSLQALNDQYYDVVLFDCPPSFGPLTINALVCFLDGHHTGDLRFLLDAISPGISKPAKHGQEELHTRYRNTPVDYHV